jgi:DNA polymerase-3 subunit delta
MKAQKGGIGRAVDQPNPETRFYLFHGQDNAQCRALADRLGQALGASRLLLSSGALKADPALLASEAGALSLFGGRRMVWVEPAAEEMLEAVQALLEGPATENPVVAIAGALRKTSGLLKLAEASPLALAFAAYAPEGEDAVRMISDVGRRFGLKVGGAVAQRLAEACGNDQAIAAQELEKLALFIDASPHSPKELDGDALDAVGAEMESDFLRLADLALGGETQQLTQELGRLPAGGSEAVPVIRSLQRRLTMLAPARARIERGDRPDAVMAAVGKTLFWKDKDAVSKMLRGWTAADLATVAERAGKLERELMFTDVPVRSALGEELLAIARRAQRR